MTQYQMGVLVMDYLQKLKVNSVAILDAVCDENLEKSYNLIQSNPTITKKEFLEIMEITEE